MTKAQLEQKVRELQATVDRLSLANVLATERATRLSIEVDFWRSKVAQCSEDQK